jgi:hypothetical protein
MKRMRGRPVGPGGRKGSDLKLRLEQALLGAIEKAAKKNNRTKSEEARQWLMDHVKRKSRAKRWPDIFALTEQIADFIEGAEEATGKEWRSDAWTNKAVLAGIEYLVTRGVEHQEAPEVPEKIAQIAAQLTEKLGEQHRDPISFGTNAAIVMSRMLDNTPEPPSGTWWRPWALRRDLHGSRTRRSTK